MTPEDVRTFPQQGMKDEQEEMAKKLRALLEHVDVAVPNVAMNEVCPAKRETTLVARERKLTRETAPTRPSLPPPHLRETGRPAKLDCTIVM